MAKVLLLDEDSAFAELVELVVRRLGLELLSLTSRQEALAVLAPRHDADAPPVAPEDVDVILVDATFTDAEHADVINAIAALPSEPALVLLMSPWLPAEPHAALADLVPSRVLHKPIDAVVLERDLAELTSSAMGSLDEGDTMASDELRQRYRRALEADRETLERAVQADGPPSGVQRVLGRLAGTAGSYGYLSLSAQARVALAALDAEDGGRSTLEELTWIVSAALASPPPPLSREPSTLGPVRWPGSALVVGDDPPTVTRVGTEFAAHGIDLKFAPSVEEALELAESYQPDLIIADARLAEHSPDGFPVDEELREGFARAIPMVLLGVADDADERVRAANAGTSVFASADEDGAVLRAAQSLAPESYLGVPIVIVDDDPDLTDLVSALLSPFGVKTYVAHEPNALFEILGRVRPALVLLDIQLPGHQGHALCRTMKAEPRWRDISIVYLTGDGRPETKVLAYQNGADDFMVKPVLGQELVAKVLSKLRYQQLAFQRQMADPLTGALSKQGIEQRLLSVLTNEGRPAGCGIMLAHVEGLREIRAEAGLLTAERALREAGQALSGAFLGRDAVGRFGELTTEGTHFVVLLLGGAPMAFHSAFDRVRRHLAEHPVFGPEGYFQQLAISAGATTLVDRDTLPAVLERGRAALDEAIRDGRSLIIR